MSPPATHDSLPAHAPARWRFVEPGGPGRGFVWATAAVILTASVGWWPPGKS